MIRRIPEEHRSGQAPGLGLVAVLGGQDGLANPSRPKRGSRSDVTQSS
jgi:hypothetical protein